MGMQEIQEIVDGNRFFGHILAAGTVLVGWWLKSGDYFYTTPADLRGVPASLLFAQMESHETIAILVSRVDVVRVTKTEEPPVISSAQADA